MKRISQLQVIVVALLILAGAHVRHALAQEQVNAGAPPPDQSDRGTLPLPSDAVPGAESAVVLRFAIASQSVPDTSALSVRACPPMTAEETQNAITVRPTTLDLITAELQKRLSKKMTVRVDVKPREIPLGTTVYSGCVTRFVVGNNAKKVLGFNWGASRIGAHVIVLTKTRSGFIPIDSFDVAVKGGNVLPPLGPIMLGVRVVQVSRETDSATAKKLADKMLKKLAKDKKAGSVG